MARRKGAKRFSSAATAWAVTRRKHTILFAAVAGRSHARQRQRDRRREGLRHSTVTELLRLMVLVPAIIQAILAGQQPRCMSLVWFRRHPLPTDWVAQREVVAGFDA